MSVLVVVVRILMLFKKFGRRFCNRRPLCVYLVGICGVEVIVPSKFVFDGVEVPQAEDELVAAAIDVGVNSREHIGDAIDISPVVYDGYMHEFSIGVYLDEQVAGPGSIVASRDGTKGDVLTEHGIEYASSAASAISTGAA